MKLVLSDPTREDFTLYGFKDVYQMLRRLARIQNEEEPYCGEFMPMHCSLRIDGVHMPFIKNGVLCDGFKAVLDAVKKLPELRRKFCYVDEIRIDEFDRVLFIKI